MLNLDSSRWFYLFVYVATGSAVSLLVKGSQQDGDFQYDPVVVNLIVEVCKLIFAACYYLSYSYPDLTVRQRVEMISNKFHVMKLFAIPAGLYCIYNFLNFYNLKLVTPPTFRVLINMKVFMSGVLLNVFFGIRLSTRQWLALSLLVSSCVIEQLGSFDWNTGFDAVMLIGLQAFCSSLAGVYFQFLLQRERSHNDESVGLWEKNLFLYIWSVLLNTFYLAFRNPAALQDPIGTLSSLHIFVIPIVCCLVIGGFSTSLILRYLDVIIKEYANFVELCAVVLGNYIIFQTPFKVTLLIAVVMVSLSLYLYNAPEENRAAQPAVAAPDIDKRQQNNADGNEQVAIEMARQNGDTEDDGRQRLLDGRSR